MGEDQGNEKVARAMPARPVQHNHAVRTRRHGRADRRQMLVHRRRVRSVRHVGDADAALRAGGAEQTGVAIAMVAHDARTLLPIRPDPCRHPLPADARFVLEPDFYRTRQRLRAERRRQLCLELRHERPLPLRVGFGVDRPPRDKAKPGPSEHHTGTALRMDDPEGLLDFPYDVLNAPARHTVPLKLGTRLDPGADPGDLRVRQPALAPAAREIREAVEALRVVAQHPVAQDLKLHALRPSRLRARRALHDHGDRTRARRLLRVPAVPRKRVELVRCVCRPGYRRCRTHRHPPALVSRSPQSMEVVRTVTPTYWDGESIWSALGMSHGHHNGHLSQIPWHARCRTLCFAIADSAAPVIRFGCALSYRTVRDFCLGRLRIAVCVCLGHFGRRRKARAIGTDGPVERS